MKQQKGKERLVKVLWIAEYCADCIFYSILSAMLNIFGNQTKYACLTLADPRIQHTQFLKKKLSDSFYLKMPQGVWFS